MIAGPRQAHAPLLGGIGLLVLVVGTFLPWLRSGRSTRNSYQTGGAVRRLIGTSGLIDHLLALWPVVGLACAAAAAVFLFGLPTVGTVLAGLSAMAAGAAAVGALATTATSYAQVAVIGPIVTLIGATLVALAVLLRALAAVAVPRSVR
jgi:uncharacterized membrane protein